MPDVNLLRDTKQPDDQRPKPRPSPNDPTLTDPSAQTKRSLGASLRSLLGRRGLAAPVVKSSAMSVDKGVPGRRVLNDKTVADGPPLTALPDDADFNVNLLTEDVVGSFNARHRLIQLGLLAMGTVVLVIGSYVGLSLYEKSINQDVKNTKEQTIQVRNETDGLQDEVTEAEQVNERLKTVEQLISKHIRWTKFFDRLEHYTLPQVTYGNSFTGALTKELTFSATADSYERVAQQYLVFKQAIAVGDFISNFSINGATKTIQDKTEIVTFNVALTLVASIFDNTLTAQAANANQNTNANTNTSSQP